MIQTTYQQSEQNPILQSQLLQKEAGIDHFCSMRGFEHPGQGVWMPRQVHGTEIVVVSDATLFDAGSELQPIDADAVITQQVGRWIGVRTADCVPVLIYDPVSRVVAAVHAGWRGTVKHITQLVAERMIQDFGCSPRNMLAMIGPSIGPEAFEVGEEVAGIYRGRAWRMCPAPGLFCHPRGSVCQTACGSVAKQCHGLARGWPGTGAHRLHALVYLRAS